MICQTGHLHYEGWRMVKSETCRDAETVVEKFETETSTISENRSPRLSAEKTEPETLIMQNCEPET